MILRIIILIIFALGVSLVDFSGIYKAKAVSGNTEFNENTPLSLVLTNELSQTDATDILNKKISLFLDKWDIKGATVAIVKNGKLVFAKGYGYANEEEKELVTPSHLFRIASASKLITAVAIMKLQENSYLSLSDKVFGENGILCDFDYSNIKDKRVYDITIEHLLRHSSGFTSRYGDQMFLPVTIAKKMNVLPPAQAPTIIQFALSKRLYFSPGKMSSYSNLGYVVLEKVIEKLTHEDYESYIQDNILRPSGVFDMHLGRSLRKDKLYNEVNYYEQNDANKVLSYDGSGDVVSKSNGGNYLEALGGAGGWIASAPELMRFVQAVDGESNNYDILNAESIKYMTTPSPQGFPPIGWKRTLSNGTWWRTGTLAGTSVMVKHQGDGVDWVFITNTSSWRGSKFPVNISAMMSKALGSVKVWPENDLFYYLASKKKEYSIREITQLGLDSISAI